MKVLRATFFVLLISMALNWPKAGWTNQTDTRLDSLFSQLQATSSETEARALEKFIWKIWLESGDSLVDRLMVGGIEAMGGGESEVDESYFGGKRKSKRGRGAAEKSLYSAC